MGLSIKEVLSLAEGCSDRAYGNYDPKRGDYESDAYERKHKLFLEGLLKDGAISVETYALGSLLTEGLNILIRTMKEGIDDEQ